VLHIHIWVRGDVLTPHPIFSVEAPRSPLPQGERAQQQPITPAPTSSASSARSRCRWGGARWRTNRCIAAPRSALDIRCHKAADRPSGNSGKDIAGAPELSTEIVAAGCAWTTPEPAPKANAAVNDTMAGYPIRCMTACFNMVLPEIRFLFGIARHAPALRRPRQPRLITNVVLPSWFDATPPPMLDPWLTVSISISVSGNP
jgi:hypothetical protein